MNVLSLLSRIADIVENLALRLAAFRALRGPSWVAPYAIA